MQSTLSRPTDQPHAAESRPADLRIALAVLAQTVEALANHRPGLLSYVGHKDLFVALAHADICGVQASRAVEYAVRTHALRPFLGVGRGVQRFEVCWPALKNLSLQLSSTELEHVASV